MGMEACHNDGNPSNNHKDNLRWDTKKANAQDAIKHGVKPVFLGEANGLSKLTSVDVTEIRRRCMSGERRKDVAAAFGVDLSNISYIVTGKTWAHV